MKSVTHHYMDLVMLRRREALTMFLLAAVAAFGLTFRQWGGDSFDPATGVFNLLAVFLCMILAIFLHEFGHKLIGALRGCTVDIKEHGYGLIASIAVQIFSFGFLPLFTPNHWEFDAHPERRIHRQHKHETGYDELWIAGGGLLGSIVAIALFKTLYTVFAQEVFLIAMLGAWLHAIFSLIPFELLHFSQLRYQAKADTIGMGDGGYLLWQSQATFGNLFVYVFAWVFVMLYGLFALVLHGLAPFLVVLLMSAGVSYAYIKWAN